MRGRYLWDAIDGKRPLGHPGGSQRIHTSSSVSKDNIGTFREKRIETPIRALECSRACIA